LSVLAAPFAGCGIENAVGPVADASSPANNEARMAANAPDLAKADLFISDPGTPDDGSTLSASTSGADYLAGSGNGPKKVHKPKRRRH
jgi:hypothetical protein